MRGLAVDDALDDVNVVDTFSGKSMVSVVCLALAAKHPDDKKVMHLVTFAFAPSPDHGSAVQGSIPPNWFRQAIQLDVAP